MRRAAHRADRHPLARDDFPAAVGARRPRFARSGFDDDRTWTKLRQVTRELGFGVIGIEGGVGRGTGDAEATHGRLGSARKDARNTIPRPDPVVGEAIANGDDARRERAKRERLPIERHQRFDVSGASGEHVERRPQRFLWHVDLR